MQPIGKPYSKDDLIDKTGFLKRARLHQSTFRALHLVSLYSNNHYLKIHRILFLTLINFLTLIKKEYGNNNQDKYRFDYA